MRLATRPIWIACGLVGLAACGNSGARVAVAGGTDEAVAVEDAGAAESEIADAGAEAGDAGGEGAQAEPPEAPPAVDPVLVDLSLAKTAEPGPDEAFGVRFEVIEVGPKNFWALAVVNRGTRPVRVLVDARTLSLDLEHPQDPKKKWLKPKRVTCRLPDALIPSEADPAYVVELAPGEGVVESFDPRFYCVPSKDGQALAPGIKVSARLGFEPKKPKVVWRKGKRVEEPVPQSPPFVLELAEAPEEDPKREVETQDTGIEGDRAVKELRATTFELNSQYGAQPSESESESPLELRMSRGSDAGDETTATVTVALKNRGKKALRVFFRRELLTFEVMGPNGLFTCDPQPDQRAPDRQAFSSLAPGGQLTATSRLIELCPQDAFATPGLYLIHGRFTSRQDGSEFGYDAFTGTVESQEPAVVRIRKGDRPYRPAQRQVRVRVGAQGASP